MLNELLKYAQANGRVCPLPLKWNELWESLPDRCRVGGGWLPALPLILAAWDGPFLLKILRLREHIEYAEEHGSLVLVDHFLRSLPESEWAHVTDFTSG